MDVHAGDAPEGFAPEAEIPPPEGFAASALAAWDDVRNALHSRGRLLTLELRLAGLTLVQLMMYAVLVAVLVVTAWLGLMGALVVALVSYGLHWAIGLAAGIVLNLAFAAWLVRSMIAMLDRLDLQASLRRIEGRRPPPQ